MTSESLETPPRGDRIPGPTPPLAFWGGLVGLLLAEALTVGVRFEGIDPEAGGHTWWVELLAQAHAIFDVFVLSAGAALLFGAADFADEFRKRPPKPPTLRTAWPFLLAHFSVFTLFFWVTAVVWEGGIERAKRPEVWVAIWLFAGAMNVATLVATALPLGFWWPMLRRCRAAVAVGLVVGVVAWFTGQYTQSLWKPLHQTTFRAVNFILGLLLPELISRPAESILGARNFSVTIHPSCSGYEGIGLTLVFVGAYLWHCRTELRFPRALVLLPLGTVLIWLTNIVRIVVLVLIGIYVSPAVALGGFHSQGGWITFLAVSLGLFIAARRLAFFRPEGMVEESEAPGPNPTVPYLAPLFALIASMMVTGALTSDFERFHPVRVLVTSAVLWRFREVFSGWTWRWSWEACGVGLLVFVIWMFLEPASTTSKGFNPTENALMIRPAWWSMCWLLFRVFGSVVTVPLAEELAFRGFLMRRLIDADFEQVPVGQFSWWSFLASSVMFGLLHGRLLAGVIAGMLYAVVVYRRRSLSDAVVAHGVTNALIAAAVIFHNDWRLWE